MIDKQEHINILRNILIENVTTQYSKQICSKEMRENIEDLSKHYEVFEESTHNFTIMQLYKMDQMLEQGKKFKFLHGNCGITQYIGIEYAGMFLGIELDGHCHS